MLVLVFSGEVEEAPAVAFEAFDALMFAGDEHPNVCEGLVRWEMSQHLIVMG